MSVSPSPDVPRPLSLPAGSAATGRVITLAPSVVLGFTGLLSLFFSRELGAVAALGFLVSAMGLLVLSPRDTIRSLWAEPLFLLLIGWCLVSFLWSQHPPQTLRYAIQLAVTLSFAIVLAYRLTPSAFLKVAASAHLVAGLASLASGRTRGDGMGFLGIFGSKNALAGAAGLLLIAGLSLLSDRNLPRRWRVIGALCLGVGGLLVVLAQSVGTMAAVGMVLGLYALVLVLRRMPPVTRLVAVTLGLLGLALLVLLAWTYADELGRLMLDKTGKDVTLTGRTDLWAIAWTEITRRPLLGTGFQAFWVVGDSLPEQIWAEFGIGSRSGFNFHNTLINNAVEIGLPGAALQAVLLFGALPPLLAWSMRANSAGPLFLTLILGRQVVLMGIEVTFFQQFDTSTVLTATAIAYAHRYRRETAAARPSRRRRLMPRGLQPS